MGMIETRILREPWEVDPRLVELGLTRAGLLKVRDAALGAAADVTPFHCANSAGTYAYHQGVFSLRDGFIGETWTMARPNGVEVIRNDAIKVLVGFSNVHLACNDEDEPQPRSEKGSGAERVAQQAGLFEKLPRYAPHPDSPWAMYYLMADKDGAAELSRPVVKDGTFSAFIERLYLSDGGDLGGHGLLLDVADVAVGFDPQVVRKAG